MSVKKLFSSKKAVKGFTLVEIIVVLVILAILAAATIPSMLGFVNDAKKKSLASEVRAVYTAAQAYATEHYAQGELDAEIKTDIEGLINSSHKLHYLLQNDATGTVFNVVVNKGKVEQFSYAKDTIKDTQANYVAGKGSIEFCKLDPNAPIGPGSIINASAGITNIDDIKSDLVDLIYPVGSLYTSCSSTSPEKLFGGTWTQIEGKFLYCMPSGNSVKKPEDSSVALSVGDTGGNTTHTHTTGDCTLTLSQIPSHSHDQNVTFDNHSGIGAAVRADFSEDTPNGSGIYPQGCNTGNAGGGQAHNHGDTGSSYNIPPYMAVYCWRRTA